MDIYGEYAIILREKNLFFPFSEGHFLKIFLLRVQEFTHIPITPGHGYGNSNALLSRNKYDKALQSLQQPKKGLL